jgi:hypothetical protein
MKHTSSEVQDKLEKILHEAMKRMTESLLSNLDSINWKNLDRKIPHKKLGAP